MTGKHYNWHKSWRRNDAGNLLHDSGLIVIVKPGDGYTDLTVDRATLEAFQVFEAARGVPFHDVAARLKRLIKEAERWHGKNP